MPKAKPTQVIVHRIELQEKEREYLEALQTTQSIKNLGYTAAAVSVPVLGFMTYKAFKLWAGQEEGTILDIFTNEGRDKIKENFKEDGFWKTTIPAILDPFGVNPFW